MIAKTESSLTETRLSEASWQEQERVHEARLKPWVESHLKRRQRGENHPVYDFLFDYYSLRAAVLMRWTPGPGVILEGTTAEKFLRDRVFKRTKGGVMLALERFPVKRLEAVRWILNLLEITAARPPQYRCFGLHEWAMVYAEEKVRYPQISLRMSSEKLKKFVNSQELVCTHYDAFRFFTSRAKPRNRWQLEKTMQPEREQRGCLHANMDLYKWSYKFHPWIPGHLMAEAFLLACEGRELDMRASPYHLEEWGFHAVPIETAEGRAEYQRLQIALAEKGDRLRQRLIAAYRNLLERLLSH